MRKVLIALAVIIAVVVIGLAVAPHFLNVNSYRGKIQAELENHLGRKVNFGALSASFLPPSIQVQNVAISEDPNFGSGEFAKAQNLDVSVAFWPLLHKQVQVKSLKLENPNIQMIRNAQGQWNYSTLGTKPAQTANNNAPAQPQPAPQAKPQPQKPGAATAPSRQPSAAQQVAINNLQIANGTLHLIDRQRNVQTTYSNIDVTLHNFAPGKQFDIDATLHVAGNPNQRLEIAGTAGPLNAGGTVPPFNGNVNVRQVSLADLQKVVSIPALNGYSGIVSAAMKATTKNDVLNSEGSAKIDDPKIKGSSLGYPLTLDYKIADDLRSGTMHIENGMLHLGQTPVSIAGSVNTNPNPAQIDLRVTTQNASLAQVVRLATIAGVSIAPGTQFGGQLNANITARGAASMPAMNGTLNASNLTITGGPVRQPVSVPQITVGLSPTTISTNQFTAHAGQSTANGQLTLTNYTTPAPHVQFALQATTLDLNAIQQVIGSGPTSAPAPRAAFFQLVPRAEAQTRSRHVIVHKRPSTAAAAPAAVSSSGMLQRMTGGGTVKIGTLTYNQLTLNNVDSKVTLDHGVIQMNPLTSQLYGGQESGSIIMDTRTNPAAVTVRTKLQNVNANNLVSSVSSLKNTIYGLLAANSNATFRTTNSANIAQTLNGTMALNLTKGRIAKIDMLNQLASVGKFLNVSSTAPKGFTDVTGLSGNFNIVNGVAQTNNLRLAIPGANLAAQGVINLVNQGLNLHVTAVLDRGFSQQVGGTGIGGFMQTALANKNGELVIPVLVTGNFDHPQVAPDMQSVAQMRLKNLVPSFGNPGAGVSGLVNSLMGGNKQGQGQGGIGGIVGALSGNQQQQTPNQQGQTPAVGSNQSNQKPQQNQNPAGNLLNQVLGGNKKPQ